MSVAGLRVLIVVPARGGSKGIPGKNLCSVAGRSLVAHAALIASALPWVDASILTTDDPAIAAEGQRYGLEVPFLRPTELSHDEATSVDVWRHAWLTTEALHGHIYDLSILLEPTSPLRRVEDIESAMQALLDSAVDCCFTVSPTPAHYTPEKTLFIRDDARIDFYLPLDQAQTTRQRIRPYVHRNGICYIVRRPHLFNHLMIVSPGSLPLLIDRPVVNIDEPFELELADWLYRRDHPSSTELTH